MVVPLGQPYPVLLECESDFKKFIYSHLSNLRTREAGIALIKLLKTIRSVIFLDPSKCGFFYWASW